MTALGLPRVLIVSIPKGGTNLLMQVILGIPGMVRTSQNMLLRGNTMQIAPGEMGVMHLPYSKECEEALQTQDVKVLFISRDPRDIAISTMHFILDGLPSHILYPAFNGYLATNEERLAAIINGVEFQRDISDTVLANELLVAHGSPRYPNVNEVCLPYLPWRDSMSVCHVTFEELVRNARSRTTAINRIVDFLGPGISSLGIPRGLLVSQMEQNINPSLSPTFRAGRIGDWRREFSVRLKEDFKRVAGKTLITLGYEPDLLW